MLYNYFMYSSIALLVLILFSSAALSYTFAKIILYFLEMFDIRKKGSKRIQKTMYGTEPEVFKKLHPIDLSDEPHPLRMGGLLVILPLLIILIPFITLSDTIDVLTLFIILLGLFFGMYDDYSVCREIKSIKTKHKIYFFAVIGAIVGLILYTNTSIEYISFILFDIRLGLAFVLFCIILFVCWGTSVVIDGIDRLSGTLMTYCYIFTAILFTVEGNFLFTIISLAVVGGLQGFLWYNSSPAKIHMSETGMVPLLLLLAFMSLVSGINGGDGLILITLISLPIHLSVVSNVIQLLYRKYTGKKLFTIAPIHHNFETMMPSHSVVSKYSSVTFLLFVICLILLFS